MKEITRSYTQRFHNSMHLFAKLSYMEIFLILWLAEQVDEDNRVITKEETRLKFINFMSKITRVKPEEEILYKDNSVRTGISNLIKQELLIKDPEKRGRCWVNPEFFFRGSPKKRMNMIRHINMKLYEEEYIR